MKISPVIGTPNISAAASTGLAPQKLARLKAIAAGETPIEVTDSPQNYRQPTPERPRMKMRTNYTVDRLIQPPESDTASETQIAIPDEGVQTNEVAEVTQPLSPQLAELAKRRRALQVKEREIIEREKALSGPTRAELEDRIKSNALSVLQEYGVTYDQLTEQILAAQNGVNPEVQALKAELKTIKEDVNKTLSERDLGAERAVLNQIAGNINRLCAEGDDFEMIRNASQQEEVLGRLYDHYLKTGEVRDELDVMREVENELVEEAVRYAKAKKVQGKLTPPPLQQQPQKTGMRTLTNKDSAPPVLDRKKRAMLAAQGLLPKG